MLRKIAFVHALPNAWLPRPGVSMVLEGISPKALTEKCQGAEILSFVRYPDHAQRVAAELGIELQANGENAPSPYQFDGLMVVASLTPGTTTVQYTLAWEGTALLQEVRV
jgi:hypothetical protein